MRKVLLIVCILFFTKNVIAQKIINNPDCIQKNFSGDITKVELTDSETVIHFHLKRPLGSWFSVPNQTYIESSADGKRLFVVKAEGTTLHRKHYMKDSDEIRYKLYFPPLPTGTKRINYGESNSGGNWFIYKLDLTKDGKNFLNAKEGLNKWTIVGSPLLGRTDDRIFYMANSDTDKYSDSKGNTMLPKDLPEDFFGNWYDKYGTLMLIATPDYIVSDFRIQYYRDIQKTGKNKFSIKSNMRSFEVLDIDNENLTIRTDRLITLKRKPSNNAVPKFIKGIWLHWAKVKEIKVTDDYFYSNDHGDLGVYEIVSRIDQVIESESGNVIWFVLYHEGNYNLYSARKINGEYVLQPRGFVNAKYKKIKD